jgi:hypothetical protein
LGLLLLAGLLCAPPALAGFEQVKPSPPAFEDLPFENPPAELGELPSHRTGVAVNSSGAGGVEAGTAFVASEAHKFNLDRYNSKGEFEAHLSERTSLGVAVSQSTGCVYAFTPFSAHAVSVFNADGSKELASFAEVAPSGESISSSPEKFHEAAGDGGVAVDGSGNVYVADHFTGAESRIMVFKPQSPTDCEHYSYAGQESDFATGQKPIQLAADDAGDIYAVVGEQSKVVEFAAADRNVPVCEFHQPANGISSLAVNSNSGQVFYNYEADKTRSIHVLEPCGQDGKFTEAQPIPVHPKPAAPLLALAVNPTLVWEPGRPAGVLYAVCQDNDELGSGKQEPSYIFAQPVSHEPVVESESVSHVTSSTALLRAQINPEGATTSYAFQYLTAAAYEANEENEPGELFAGATEAPLGGAVLGTGQDALPAAASVIGLTPETEYRYRVIATSAEGSDEGDAESFRTYAPGAEGPPDGRVYELVSPTRKEGGEVFPLNPQISSCEAECKPGSALGHLPVQSATNGDGLVYEGFPFSSTGAPKTDEYLSRRTASGWQTTNPTPPSYLGHPRTGYFAFSGDLATGLLVEDEGSTLSPEAPAGYPNLFLQGLGNPTVFSPLVREPPPNRPPEPGESLQLEYAGATEDLSHILFAANDALTPEAKGEDKSKSNLYEWSGGELRLVNVLPNGETVPGAAFGSGLKLSKEKTDISLLGDDFSHAISADGSRIFWSSDESGQVYLRIDGEETLEVLDHEGQFVTASADGAKVLLSDGCLYDLGTESCTDLNGSQEGFEGILGQSEDLSSIYFLDTAALTPEAEENANGEHAEEGKDNVYSWQEGSLSFVATLAKEDKADWTIAPIKRTAEASPDGGRLAFLSRVPLTGAENIGPCLFSSQKPLPGPCPEAFLFDAGSGKLVCASCDPSGEAPLGPTFLPTLGIGGLLSPLLQPRYLTDAGRLFFDSRDSLSPFDTNGNAEDVYEYEPQGVGSCTHEGGCTSLVSAGHEPIDSNFLAIDPGAENAFFTTRDQLALQDRDELIDVYDAREGGGIPAEGEVARGECQGEACQPAAIVPDDPTPASSSFSGAGNVKQGKPHKKKHKQTHKRKQRHHRAEHRRHADPNHGGAK